MFYQFQHFGMSEYFRKEYGENFNFPSHLHQSFEFITALSGSMDVMVNGKMYTITGNEAILIFPNQIHSLSGNRCSHMLCIFSPEIVKAYYSKTLGKEPSENKFLLSNYLIEALKTLYEESSKIKKKGILYSICSEFDEKAAYNRKKIKDKNLLHRIFEFVELNYNKDCSLEKLSEETAFSYSYLSRYFKNTVAMSFNSYVNMYRISKACYILNNSDNTIIECALECGYSSLRSFNRNFKLYTSMTPQEYRKHSI